MKVQEVILRALSGRQSWLQGPTCWGVSPRTVRRLRLRYHPWWATAACWISAGAGRHLGRCRSGGPAGSAALPGAPWSPGWSPRLQSRSATTAFACRTASSSQALQGAALGPKGARAAGIGGAASRGPASASCWTWTAVAIAGWPSCPTRCTPSSPWWMTPPSGCSTRICSKAARAWTPYSRLCGRSSRRMAFPARSTPIAPTGRRVHADSGTGPDRTRGTQVGRTLARLGVEHILGYSPQAGGRSEPPTALCKAPGQRAPRGRRHDAGRRQSLPARTVPARVQRHLQPGPGRSRQRLRARGRARPSNRSSVTRKNASSRGTTPSRLAASCCRSPSTGACAAAPACACSSVGISMGAIPSGGGRAVSVATAARAGSWPPRPPDPHGEKRSDHVSNASGRITCQRHGFIRPDAGVLSERNGDV
jgi:hypothetical protein